MNEIISVTASNAGFMNSGAGKLWVPGAGPTYIDCPLGQAQSSSMAVWLVSGSGNPIPPGQLLQSVRFSGQHSYIVDLGGPTKTRECAPFGGVGPLPTNIGGSARLGTAIGTGNGAAIDVPVNVSALGMRSDHYNNDQLFVGVNAFTDGADSFYAGLYHFEALNWTLYFGQPIPPPTDTTTPLGHFTNPVGNNQPGKIAGVEQFESVKFTIDQPNVGDMTWTWRLTQSSGFTFASNGQRTLVQQMGYHTVNHNVNSCGKINIPPGSDVRVFNMYIDVTGMTSPASPNALTMGTTLTVRTTGGMFMEA